MNFKVHVPSGSGTPLLGMYCRESDHRCSRRYDHACSWLQCSHDPGRRQPVGWPFPKIENGSGKPCRFLYTSLTTEVPKGKGGRLEPLAISWLPSQDPWTCQHQALAQYPYWVTSSPLPMGQAPSVYQGILGPRICPWSRSHPPHRGLSQSSRNNYSLVWKWEPLGAAHTAVHVWGCSPDGLGSTVLSRAWYP